MIHIKRKAQPAFMRSPEFQELRQEYRDYALKGGTRGTQARFGILGRLYRFRDEIVEALEAQFGSVCAYTGVESARRRRSKGKRLSSNIETDAGLRLAWHRPRSDATSLDGTISPRHYWWHVLDWKNWYLASPQVDVVKGTQFPVVRERSKPPEGEQLRMPRIDRGVLLDPCRDEPSWWLRFNGDGTVSPRAHPQGGEQRKYEPFHRGEETIRILGLNEERLVTQRLEVASFVETKIGEWMAPASEPDLPPDSLSALAFVERALEEVPVHPGPMQQLVIRYTLPTFLEDKTRQLGANVRTLLDLVPLATVAGEIQDLLARVRGRDVELPEPAYDRLQAVWRDLYATYLAKRPVTKEAAGSLEPAAAPSSPSESDFGVPKPRPQKASQPEIQIGASERITKVEVENFRAIRRAEVSLSLEPVKLPEPYSAKKKAEEAASEANAQKLDDDLEGVGWKVFLGENGSGKSSLLLAVALALSGDDADGVVERAQLEWKKLLRRPVGDETVEQGMVQLTFSGGQKVRLDFDHDGSRFGESETAPHRIYANVRAYGATRLVGDVTPPRLEGDANVVVDNLFDPNARVVDAKEWLLGLDDGSFNVAAITLAELLGRPATDSFSGDEDEEQRVLRDVKASEITIDGDPFEVTSDGYKTILAIGCDILRGTGGLDASGAVEGGVSDFREATGIVLIDEIGSHLHPRWRMEITSKLRRALPRVQFLASTHEPLCLRGLQENEVVRVLKSTEHGALFDPVERSPSNYRVDQLLTSEFFGLDSVIDPEIDERLKRYYDLKNKDPRNEREDKELRELNEDLRTDLRPVLGFTRRDQLVYDAIDDFLTRERDLGLAQQRAERKATIDKVRKIWDDLDESMP